MEKLNRTTAPQAKKYTEKIIQFGEGNFLRAFIEWIIWKTNQKTDFNASVVVVQPIEKGMVGWLNEQDGLYHLNLQGLQDGEPVDSVDLIDVVSRGLSPYEDFQGYLKLAEQPQMRFVISNTTEAGIAFDPACKLDDAPASSYPGKLTQLLYHRWEFFKGDKTKGFLIFPCELIFENGKHLKECIRQYIDLLRRLDHPQMEDLGLVQQMVVIAHAFAQLRGGIPRITRDDAVHERTVHAAGLLEPGAEILTQVPQVDILTDAFLQMLAVFEDELAREDDESLGLVALEVLPAVIQELR